MRRGDIFALRLPKGVGHEQRGPHFGVVVQSDAFLPRSVVLVAPTCYHAPFRPFVYLFRSSLFAALARRLAGPWLVWPVLRSQYFSSPLLTPQVSAQYRPAFRRPEYLHACAGLLRDYWSHAFTETARSYGKIRVPLHLVWGAQDIWVSTRDGLRLAADTGAALTVIAGAGHLVHQAPPEPFNEALKWIIPQSIAG